MVDRQTRQLTVPERERVRKALERRRAHEPVVPARRPAKWIGLSFGLGLAVLLFVVWRQVVWEAAVGFGSVGLFVGWLVEGALAPKHVKPRSSRLLLLEATLASGQVEEVALDVSRAVVLHDGGDDAWFLQVAPDQVLCLWEPDEVRARLSLVWARHEDQVFVLGSTAQGAVVKPARPKRTFRFSEYRPKYDAEFLSGTLEDLDATLLRMGTGASPAPSGPLPPVVDEVEPLGFYKYVDPEVLTRVKAAVADGPDEWLVAAGRSFEAEPEVLIKGGVGDLLELLQPVLSREGCSLGAVREDVREGAGLMVTLGGTPHGLWSDGEAPQVLLTRLGELLDGSLSGAGSQERVFFRDGQLVVLNPELKQRLELLRREA